MFKPKGTINKQTSSGGKKSSTTSRKLNNKRVFFAILKRSKLSKVERDLILNDLLIQDSKVLDIIKKSKDIEIVLHDLNPLIYSTVGGKYIVDFEEEITVSYDGSVLLNIDRNTNIPAK